MTIIVFLIDSSATMNQKIFLGGRPSLLDVAKSAVEYFVKVRQRSSESRGDRYMLLTFEDPPNNIKAGWKENLQTFMSELKNIQANGLTTLGNALRNTFDVLNVNRMQHGIDTYGQGRCPFYLEPSIIIVITDGGRLSSNSGVTEELKLHGASPGAELTREPFRWDQRLFALVLKMSGQPTNDLGVGLVPPDDSPIEHMCDATGGRSYSITTHRTLHQCLESIAGKVATGVVLHFEKYGPDPTMTGNEVKEEEEGKWHSTRRMIFVPRSNNQKGVVVGGFWPIPESFWPDPSLPTLPSRMAHPNIKFICQPHEPLVIENFPFDKYELEPNPLTQFILARKQPSVCWQVFLQNSSKSSTLGHAFGYLKASSTLTAVNLFIMPYNYPMLLPLLQELIQYRMKPTNEWRAQFGMYLSTVPPYYLGPLKRALLRIGAGNISQVVPEENYLSYSVLNYLKKLKQQAKIEYERTCSEVGARVLAKETPTIKRGGHLFKNAYDVPRDQLLDHLIKLRSHFFRPSSQLQSQESLHNQPVSQMGNYQEYLKRMPTPLREIESSPVRQHLFGNPFKVDKRFAIDKIDEADLDPVLGTNNGDSSATATPSRKPKRKPGPLPREYHFIPMKKRGSMTPEQKLSHSPWSDRSSESLFDLESPNPSPAPSPMYSSPALDEDITEMMNVVTPPPPAPVSPMLLNSLDHELENNELNNEKENMNWLEEDVIKEEPTHVVPVPETDLLVEENHVQIPAPVSSVQVNDAVLLSITNNKVEPIIAAAINDNRKPRENQTTTVEDEEFVRKRNLEIRIELYKEIRRPKVRMDFILEKLQIIAGSSEVRKQFVKNLELEALKFKRKNLAQVFQQQRELLDCSS